MALMSRGTFLVAAPDQVGLVARLAGFFAERGLNIVDASNHTDGFAAGGPRFFMRLVVDLGEREKGEIARAFDELARALGGA
jgi:formyltetrahydrofolate deformylase